MVMETLHCLLTRLTAHSLKPETRRYGRQLVSLCQVLQQDHTFAANRLVAYANNEPEIARGVHCFNSSPLRASVWTNNVALISKSVGKGKTPPPDLGHFNKFVVRRVGKTRSSRRSGPGAEAARLAPNPL